MAPTIPFLRPKAATKNAAFEVSAEAVLSAVPAATLVVDPTMVIRFANPSAEQLFKASAPALVGE
ncbi:MAG: PAS domain-containing protein, partial [Rhodospirillaceae bacterium]